MTRRSDLMIALDEDVNALGYARKREFEPFPREFVTLKFPMSWPYTATINVPARMTEYEWDALLGFLDLAKAGLVPAAEARREP